MAERLKCDLVMRGGITSGIVYPRAIAELAKTYDFCSIGGTSAGAIAAAGTAAAAYGARHNVEPDPFQEQIAALPRQLGSKVEGKTTLERLFQPQDETRPLFRLLMSSLGHETFAGRMLSVGGSLLRNYWPFALGGAATVLVPLLLVIGLSAGFGGWLWLVTLVLMGPAVAIVAAVMAAYGAYRDVKTKVPDNSYGLCAGSSNNATDEAGILPLTDWLNDLFQRLAGRERDDDPLTFGELWGNDGDPEEPRDIELVLMTTNVTRGISQRFPFFEGSWGRLFFKKEDFDKLFPKSVVDHVCAKGQHRREVEDQKDWERYEAEVDTTGFVPLPLPADLPIVLGARMSLSFPFLLSAVPLYAANVLAKFGSEKTPLERCWFSDGGLTSNFPLHFFDSPLPRHPTFGINLTPATVRLADTDGELDEDPGEPAAAEDAADEDPWDYIYMPRHNGSGISDAAPFNRFEQDGPNVGGFFGAMFDTARNWADTELMAMPGYRDRIVHVMLKSDEGGMNLNMPDTIIERVGDRGKKAGELLAARFAEKPGPDPRNGGDITLTWDNHRWIRFRSLMAGLELVFKGVRRSWNTGYGGLLDRPLGNLPSYKFRNEDQRTFARQATTTVLKTAKDWESGIGFDRYDGQTAGRSPRPKPALRMMPLGSNDPRAERPTGSDMRDGPGDKTV